MPAKILLPRQPAAHVLGVVLGHQHWLVHGLRIVDSLACMPQATCGSPECANPPAGCAPITSTLGFFCLRKRDTPVMVPVVPMALTKCVMRRPSAPRSQGRSSRSGCADCPHWRTGPAPCLRPLLHGLGQIAPMHAAAAGVSISSAPKGLHGLRTLDRQVLRHHQHHAVPRDGSRRGQRNAGVARGGLDQRIARPDVPTLLGGGSSTAPDGLSPTRRVIASSLPKMTLPCIALSQAPMRCSATMAFCHGVLNRRIFHAPTVP